MRAFRATALLGAAALLLAASAVGCAAENVDAAGEQGAAAAADPSTTTSSTTTSTTPVTSDAKRQGRKKKRVDGTLFASYGLSPERSDPHKVVDYSAAAVSAASSAATRPAARAKPRKKPTVGGAGRGPEPSAPGTQAKVDLRPFMSAVENQRDSNSCAANAVAGAYEYLATRAALRDGEDEVGEISRLFIYYVGRKRDQITWGEDTTLRPKDEGMTLGGAIEAVQRKGAALQKSWPFDLRRVNHRPADDAFVEAIRYKVGEAMSVPIDLDRMRQCLSDGYPIVFGLKLTQRFFSPPSDGFVPTPDPADPKSAEHGLHAMLLVGYNDRQRVFIVRNSWGSDWGVGGYAYLSYDYVANRKFNFVGMYAIQSLTDDDLTPDGDDGEDLDQDDEPAEGHDVKGGDVEDHEDDEEEDEEDDFDADDMFDTQAEARRAFGAFAGDNMRLSKAELKNALLLMGIPMVTDDEVNLALRRYDDDGSGYISWEEFLDMHSVFDGSLIRRRRKLNKFKRVVDRWFGKARDLFGTSQGEGGASAEL